MWSPSRSLQTFRRKPPINNCKVQSTTPNTVTVPTVPFKLHKLDKGPPEFSTVSKEQARKWLYQMLVSRRMEHACTTLYKTKTIRGFCHLYTGQEAVAVGINSQIGEGDALITAYRCHSWAYLRGVTPHQVIAEVSGKVTGNVKGKGGSMHIYATNFYGGNGIVGAQVPLGTGVALTYKLMKKNNVMFVVYGEGAANQGQVFEAFNIAKLWKLPVIYICENNHYAMGTAEHRSSASTKYYTRGDYVPGIFVDGMNLVSVREATKYAIDHVKAGLGPIVLEMNTYRYYGHSMSDPGSSYRSKDEVSEVRKTRDPIAKFKALCVKHGLLTEQEITDLDKKAKAEIEADVKKAQGDGIIKDEELTYDLYRNFLDKSVRGVLPWKGMPHKYLGIRNEKIMTKSK